MPSLVYGTSPDWDLNDSNFYNLRFTADNGARMGWMRSPMNDLNGNGRDDLVMHARMADNNGTNSGSVYIIFDDILDQLLAGNNKNIDLLDSSNYSVRIDGQSGNQIGFYMDIGDVTNDSRSDLLIGGISTAAYIVPYEVISAYYGQAGQTFNLDDTDKFTYKLTISNQASTQFGDVNSDGKLDVMIANPYADNNGSNSGSIYVLYNDLISSTTRGNTIAVESAGNFTLRVDGGIASSYGLAGGETGDVDGDGKNEFIVGHNFGSYYGRDRSGGIFIIDGDILPSGGTDNILQMSDTNDFSIHLWGGPVGLVQLNGGISLYDVDDDGKSDIFAGAGYYFWKGSFLSPYIDEPSEVIDLTDTNNYTLKFSGPWFVGSIADYTNDGKVDLLISQSDYGTVIDNQRWTDLTVGVGNTINLSSSGNYIAKFTSESTSIGTHFNSLNPVDFNNDGKYDYVIESDNSDINGTNTGAYWIILNFPHTITMNSLGDNLSATNFNATGTVSASQSVNKIAGVQWSFSNNPTGTWNSCTASDGTFDSTSEAYSCTISGFTEGDKTFYIRAYDTSGSYTAQSRYATHSYRSDTTLTTDSLPVSVYDPDTGRNYEKYFRQTTVPDLSSVTDTEYPLFCFTKAYDIQGGSGISKYTVFVDNTPYIGDIPYIAPSTTEYGARPDGGKGVIKETNEVYMHYKNYDVISATQEICLQGKGEHKRLNPGLHTWQVEVMDNAGNSVKTDTRRFLVKSNSGTYSEQNTWFPLTVSQIGNKTQLTAFSTLKPRIYTPHADMVWISTPYPTFFGIANTGAVITLSIEKESIDKITNTPKRTQVGEQQTTANVHSRWSINLSKEVEVLEPNMQYYITIKAESADNTALIQDIPVKLSVY